MFTGWSLVRKRRAVKRTRTESQQSTLALVFNPIFPLRLKRETWEIVDIVAAVLPLLSIAVMDIRKPHL